MTAPLLLTGLGLKAAHYTSFLNQQPPVAWVEVHSENYFVEGGRPLHILEKVRENYPVSLHGVSLSLGSADDLNWQHLKKLRDLSERIQPCLISEHLSWSSINGQYLHDLLPLPYTEEALAHIITRIRHVQDYLNKQILIENISSYLHFEHSVMPEWEFLVEVSKQAGCGILLDVNNVYLNAYNLGFDAHTYINAIPRELVQEIHLAGFSKTEINQQEVLIDSHDKEVAPDVWGLYRYAISQLGSKPTIIEWDNNLPSLDTLLMEAQHAEKIMRESYASTKSAS